MLALKMKYGIEIVNAGKFKQENLLQILQVEQLARREV
jgi:hypothetical protein